MKKSAGVVVVAAILSPVAATFQGCDTKKYEDCPSEDIIADWGVTFSTHAFGGDDSIYYLINPIGNVADSLYFNGNYTDSYYHSDSTRVMLRYTTSDSIVFHIDRMYSVQTNPPNIVMKVKTEERDSDRLECELRLIKDDDSDKIYRCGPDSAFKRLLKKGTLLRFSATNGPSTSEPSGSQNYEFILNAAGFEKAFRLADSLNNPAKFEKIWEKDSLKKADKKNEKKHKFL